MAELARDAALPGNARNDRDRAGWARRRSSPGRPALIDPRSMRQTRTDAIDSPSAQLTDPPSAAARHAWPVKSAATRDHCLLLLVDIERSARLWGWSRLVRGNSTVAEVEGLRWSRVLGSGRDGGFGLAPSASRQGLFLVFDDVGAADRFIDCSPLLRAYRDRARELLLVRLAAYAVRGAWSGRGIAAAALPPSAGPIAALTRASIRVVAAPRFWRHAPPSQAALESAPGCLLAVGLGEAPLLRQATFSLWDSMRSMDAYARSGAHLAAIHAAHAQGFFRESMFVRFAPLAIDGTWKGRVYTDELLGTAN